MRETYEYKKILFSASYTPIVGNWRVGNKATTPNGLYKNRNTTRPCVFSQAAIAFQNLLSKKLRVCIYDFDAESQSLYCEYSSSKYGMIRSVVTMSPNASGVVITTDQEFPHQYAEYLAAQFTTAFFLTANPKTASRILNGETGGLTDLQMTAMSIYDSPPLTVDTAALLCDTLYYGVVKNNNITIDIKNDLIFDAVINQMIRSSTITSCYISASPSGILAGKSKKAHKITQGQNPLLSCSLEEFQTMMINGRFILPIQWTEDQKSRISPLGTRINNSFVLDEGIREMITRAYMGLRHKFEMVINGIDLNSVMGPDAIVENFMIAGPPASSKSYIAKIMFEALGLPEGTFYAQAGTEDQDVEGGPKIVDGAFEMIPSTHGDLIPYGGGDLTEECNLPKDPAVFQGTLGQATCYPYTYKEFGYREVKRSPWTVMAFTMNPVSEGTRPISDAFATRIANVVIRPAMSEKDAVRILKKRFKPARASQKAKISAPDRWTDVEEYFKSLGENMYPKVSDADILKAARICEHTIQFLKDDADMFLPRISNRATIECLNMVGYGFSWKSAVRSTFVGQIYLVDEELSNELEDALKMFL